MFKTLCEALALIAFVAGLNMGARALADESESIQESINAARHKPFIVFHGLTAEDYNIIDTCKRDDICRYKVLLAFDQAEI